MISCILIGYLAQFVPLILQKTWAGLCYGVPMILISLRRLLGLVFYLPISFVRFCHIRLVADTLLTRVEGPLEEISEGKLILRDGVFYYEVQRPTGRLLVRVGPEALFFQQKQDLEERKESMMPGSIPMKVSALPKGQVILRGGNQVVGYGCRTVMNGKEGLLTAAHVLQDLRKCAERSIGTLEVHYPMGDWETILYSQKADIAFLEVPHYVWSRLGVAKAQASRLPTTNTPISVCWQTTEGTMLYRGVVLAKKLFFSHTASTTYGVSGAPLYWNQKVVGVHLSGKGDHNVGLALDPFLGGKESDARDTALMSSPSLEEGERYVVYRAGEPVVLRNSGRFYSLEEVETKLRKKTGKSWYDMVQEEEEEAYDGSLESGLTETEQVFQTGRVRASAPTSVPTTGETQKKSEPRRRRRRSNSKKSVGHVSPSEAAMVGKTELRKASTSECPPSENGGGLPAVQMQFGSLSSTMLASSGQESGLREQPKSEPLKQPVQLILRSGRIPKHIREFLTSLHPSLKCGKNRMWLLQEEVSQLEKGEQTELVKEALKWKRPV